MLESAQWGTIFSAMLLMPLRMSRLIASAKDPPRDYLSVVQGVGPKTDTNPKHSLKLDNEMDVCGMMKM